MKKCLIVIVLVASIVSQTLEASIGSSFIPSLKKPTPSVAITPLDNAKKFTPPSAKQNKTLLQENHLLTTKERRIIRQQFEKFINGKEAKNLSLQDLRTAADFCLKLAVTDKSWYKKSLIYLEQLITTSKDTEQLKALKLEVCDISFEQGDLEKAGNEFTHYIELYPGSEHAEYAHYKRILCQFYQTYKIDQDQQPTITTQRLAQSYLSKSTIYKQYRTEIKEILSHCTLMLYNSEINVINFYFKKRNYNAASNRIAYVKKEFLPKISTIEPEILSFECRIAKAQNNTELYNEKLALLEKKFPRYASSIRVVQSAKKSHANRF